MPDGDINPVTFGRWQAEHQRLADRVSDLERRLDTEIRDLRADFEQSTKSAAETIMRRRDRQWNLILAFLTALVLPLAAAAVIALLTTR